MTRSLSLLSRLFVPFLSIFLVAGLPISAVCTLSAPAAAQGAPDNQVFDVQFFGDVFFPGHVLNQKKSVTPTPNPLAAMGAMISTSRVNVVNFEGVATRAFFPNLLKTHLLRTPPKSLPLLRAAGITGITLANNHSMDFGIQGLFDTLAYSKIAGLLVAGAGFDEEQAKTPMIVTSATSTYCIFALSRTLPMSFWATPFRGGTATTSIADASNLFSSCSGTAQYPIASIHWGRELSRDVQDYQRLLAHSFIDGGAIAVIGHHPHILQEIEIYKGRPIFYSLGNFAFGSLTGPGRQEGAAVAILKDFDDSFLFRVSGINVENRIVQYVPRPFSFKEKSTLTPIIEKTKGCQKMAASDSYLCKFTQ